MKCVKNKAVLLLVLIPIICCWHLSYAQKKAAKSNPSQGETWAVVIGISKYKNVPGLNFADNDAVAFYHYLTNNVPGLTAGHVKLLLNSEASSSDIYGALDWLTQSVKKNDRVIFYFSGHGDAEQIVSKQYGFLLAYNSPATAYAASGSVSTSYLLKYFDHYLNVNHASQVILFADACRSGELAGGKNGAHQTIKALSERNDPRMIRILSAQQNERSFEGNRWGGGHGVFSYYLIKALQGAADLNRDNHLTIAELALYMHQTVPGATDYAQNPYISGNPKLVLFAPDNHSDSFNTDSTETIRTIRGINNSIINKLSPSVAMLYRQYLVFLQQEKLVCGEYLSDTINCARHYYLQLVNNPQAAAIRPSLCSSFVAALQHKAQNLLDNFVKMQPLVYHADVAFLEINYALKIVEPDYILHDYLMARLWFLSIWFNKGGASIPALIHKSLALEPDSPLALNELGNFYTDQNKVDSANYYLRKAIELAPKWPYPYNNLGYMYNAKGDLKNAIANFKIAVAVDSTYGMAWYNIGLDYQKIGDTIQAMACYRKVLRTDPGNKKINHMLTYNNIGALYHDRGNYTQAIAYYQQALNIDSNYADGWYNIGESLDSLKDYAGAISAYKKSLTINSSQADVCNMIGTDFNHLNQPHDAIYFFQQSLKLDTNYTAAYYGLGLAEEKLRDYPLAETNFQHAVKRDTGNLLFLAHLSCVLMKNKKIEEGTIILTKACNLSRPSHKNAHYYYEFACAWLAANKKKQAQIYLKTAIANGLTVSAQELKDDGLNEICTSRVLNKWHAQYDSAIQKW